METPLTPRFSTLTPFTKMSRARLKETHSSSVPSGQIQPHQARPTTNVTSTVISAKPRRGIHWREASMLPRAESGSKRKKISASGGGMGGSTTAKGGEKKKAKE